MNQTRAWVRVAGGALCLFLAVPGVAHAQAEGFALNRFEPSERGSDWFVLDSLDLRGHQRFSAGLVLDYGHKPLVIYSPGDEEVASIVRTQMFAHLGGGVVLWDRARFALNLPIALLQDGERGTAGTTDFSSSNATTIGDLRVSADVRLVGTYGEPITLSSGLQFFVPTGSQDAFTGDGTVRFGPRVAAAGEIGDFVYASSLGLGFRAKETFAGSRRGSELAFGVAAGARATEALIIGPELNTTTVVINRDSFFGRRTTPLELLFGAHYRATDSLRINGGAGPGLTRAFGTPRFRALVSLEWLEPIPVPPKPPSDRDGDQILDSEDACPDVPGVRTTDPRTNGCPPPSDRDEDGVLDDDDACPDVKGVPTDDPKTNGCPPPSDRDEDGVLDDDDACPDVAGVPTEDPKTNGCPDRDKDKIPDQQDACPDEPGEPSEDPKKHGCPVPKDADGDGILDADDACPQDPGPANEDPKKHGCPVARVEKGQIVIREQVQFAYNSDQILSASDFILKAVQEILEKHPEIRRLSVEGHTDSKGSEAYNKRLSERRARSVMRWLIQGGVRASRLEAKGYGEEKPMDTNDTEEGRASNRRVEFHIIEQATTEGSIE